MSSPDARHVDTARPVGRSPGRRHRRCSSELVGRGRAAVGRRDAAGPGLRPRRRRVDAGRLPLHRRAARPPSRDPRAHRPVAAPGPIAGRALVPRQPVRARAADLFGIEPIGHPQPRRLVLHQHWPEGWHPMRRDSRASPADGRRRRIVPLRTGGGHRRLRDSRRTGARRAHRAGPLPLLGGGGDHPADEGPAVVRPQGDRAAVPGEDHRRGSRASPSGSPGTPPSGTAWPTAWPWRTLAARGAGGRASELRGVLLELERLYNHVADVGALCNDVGFGIAQAWALTLRERLLRLNRAVTGHRLLRGGVVPGGARVRRLPTAGELAEIGEQFEELVELVTSSALVMDRFTGTAVLDRGPRRRAGGGRGGRPGIGAGLRRPDRPSVRRHPSDGFVPAQDVGRGRARPLPRAGGRSPGLAGAPGRLRRTRAMRLDVVTAARRIAPVDTGGVGIAEGWRGADRPPGRTRRRRAAWRGSRSSTRPSSTGRRYRCPWPTRSSPTSPWPTRASTSPTPETTSDECEFHCQIHQFIRLDVIEPDDRRSFECRLCRPGRHRRP